MKPSKRIKSPTRRPRKTTRKIKTRVMIRHQDIGVKTRTKRRLPVHQSPRVNKIKYYRNCLAMAAWSLRGSRNSTELASLDRTRRRVMQQVKGQSLPHLDMPHLDIPGAISDRWLEDLVT